MEPIPHSELTHLEVIGEGGFGVVYRAKHQRFGTVVYKELDARKLGDRYLNPAIFLARDSIYALACYMPSPVRQRCIDYVDIAG